MRQIVYGLGAFIYGSVTCIAYVAAFAFYIGIFIPLITGVWAGWLWAFLWLVLGLGISFLLVGLLSFPIRGIGMLLMYIARGPEYRAEVDTSRDKTAAKLIEALQDKDAAVRDRAATALVEIGDGNFVADLSMLLWHKNPGVRDNVAFVIGELRPYLKDTTYAFVETLTNNDRNARRNAAITLGEIGDRSAIFLLGTALSDKSPDVRIHAAEALGEIGPDAKEMVPVLIEALKDKDENVSEAAAEALKKIEG